jgi:type IV pilus assembly protein PilM
MSGQITNLNSKYKKKSFLELVSTVFPPPEFLKMSGVGLDISDHAVRFLELRQDRRGKLSLGHYGAETLAKGIVEQGEIRDKQALVSVIKTLRNKAKFDYIYTSLPDEKAYLFQVRGGKEHDDKSFRNFIEFSLEENIPLSPRDAVFDYDIVGHEGDNLIANVVALPSVIADSYYDVFKESGVIPLCFEIEAEAIGRAVLSHQARETGLIVDFGALKSNIMIVVGDVVRFATVIDIGSDRLTSAIARYMKISEQEAENIKRSGGFLPTKENKQVFEILLNIVSVLRDEINKYLLYWNAHQDDGVQNPSVEKILLVGGGANLEGLDEYLSTCFDLPVCIADVWINCFDTDNYLPEITKEESLSFVTAIGLALRSLNRY